MLEDIIKRAKTEYNWLKYYTMKDSFNNEKFDNIDFYNTLISIGYCKVPTKLDKRCCMGCVDSLILSKVTEIYSTNRNHPFFYTCLEFCIKNNINYK